MAAPYAVSLRQQFLVTMSDGSIETFDSWARANAFRVARAPWVSTASTASQIIGKALRASLAATDPARK